MASYITLNYLDLALASILVLIDAGLSMIGLVLTALFSPLWTGLAVLAMILR
jgi:hypothetical protein